MTEAPLSPAPDANPLPDLGVAPVTPPITPPDLGVAPVTPEAVASPYTFSMSDKSKPKGEDGKHPPVQINMDLNRVPAEVQDYLFKTAIKAYVQNRTSTAFSAADKANADNGWLAYESAIAHDPLQSGVPMPSTPKVEVDFYDVIQQAVKALYENTIGKRDGTGTKKKPERKDPLISAITRTVVQEVFEKNYALDNNYKFPMASKEVGTDGLAYLRAKMAANVAAGIATAEQMDYILETKYLKPARIMLGLDAPGKLKDAVGIL